jgi:hypothetical protein
MLHHYCFGNTYVVGSSKKITGGLLTNSNAMDSLLRSPPDNLYPKVSAALVKRNKSNISSTCNQNNRKYTTNLMVILHFKQKAIL